MNQVDAGGLAFVRNHGHGHAPVVACVAEGFHQAVARVVAQVAQRVPCKIRYHPTINHYENRATELNGAP